MTTQGKQEKEALDIEKYIAHMLLPKDKRDELARKEVERKQKDIEENEYKQKEEEKNEEKRIESQ